jgi:NTE family protein
MRKTPVTLALQGGGSHGAFTWGVLDHLLEDGRVDIAAVSGASAGAMNAVAFAYGDLVGGRDGARQALKDFWEAVAAGAPPNFLPIDWAQSDGLQVKPTPAFTAFLSMVRFFAPYQLNPFDLNPLRDILAKQIDSTSSSRPRGSAPARCACFARVNSRWRCCSPQPACRPCTRR